MIAGQTRGIQTILNTIVKPFIDADMRRKGCGVLNQITEVKSSISTRVSMTYIYTHIYIGNIQDVDNLGNLVTVMTLCICDEDTCKQGFAALFNLTAENSKTVTFFESVKLNPIDDNQVRVLEFIERIANVMANHKSNIDICNYGCTILYKLSKNTSKKT